MGDVFLPIELRADWFTYLYNGAFMFITVACLCCLALTCVTLYSVDILMCAVACLALLGVVLITGSIAFTGWRNMAKSKSNSGTGF